MAAWLINPEIADPSHRSGVLSFAYLALSSPLGRHVASETLRRSVTTRSSPTPRREHVRNVVRDIGPAGRFAVSFGYRRLVPRRRAPGFSVYSDANTYRLNYHAEQVPNPDSRVTLAEQTDELGVPRLRIDLRLSGQDVDSIVRAHRHWDAYLRRHDRGRLEFLSDDLEASVREQFVAGTHQVGTTRMSGRPEDGVVGPDLAVHGFDDLYVASSSAFPTSGQANSTFTLVAFAVRLADHLRGELVRRPALAKSIPS